ncbi:hypothetical protein NSA19_01015 [Actinomyces bowdenii]|uniref:hypothetical protein n=1 Tax=Actinomyces bowdenii TaxID=131109 RepID=UPI00214B83F4|nr:hypothetical protein [Actinomyces bowdenii]MCR2051457.1 hypothetical protein [Actinomyces bowdenii]
MKHVALKARVAYSMADLDSLVSGTHIMDGAGVHHWKRDGKWTNWQPADYALHDRWAESLTIILPAVVMEPIKYRKPYFVIPRKPEEGPYAWRPHVPGHG